MTRPQKPETRPFDLTLNTTLVTVGRFLHYYFSRTTRCDTNNHSIGGKNLELSVPVGYLQCLLDEDCIVNHLIRMKIEQIKWWEKG